jgi:transcription elongation factor Elf1
MIPDLLSENALKALSLPLIACPICKSGSSELTTFVIQQNVWEIIKCSSCGNNFEIAEAIDENFAANEMGGYSIWAGGCQVTKQVICESGKTTLVDIKGVFEEIYFINHGFVGGANYLAGGISTQFIPQGFIMVCVAPNPSGETNCLNILLNIEGQKSKQPELLPWQQMLLRAKLNLFSAPYLTVIMSLNAVDLFIEQLTKLEIESVKGKGRPDIWSYHINNSLNISLRKLLGKKDFLLIEKFVQTRNALAHGGNYLEKLPANIRDREEEWLSNGKYREGIANYSPCANFTLSCSLKIIRNCRRVIES